MVDEGLVAKREDGPGPSETRPPRQAAAIGTDSPRPPTGRATTEPPAEDGGGAHGHECWAAMTAGLVAEAPRRSHRRTSVPPVRTTFRPDIQGLRAVAVLAVALDHADLGLFSGGYVGVDVFFVISGFLITQLLLREASSTGRISLTKFYGRRARRILPAATLVTVVTTFASVLLLDFVRSTQVISDSVWATFFAANALPSCCIRPLTVGRLWYPDCMAQMS